MPNFAQRSFVGYNNRISPFLLPDDTPSDAFDVILDDFGNLEKRAGFSRFNSSAISSSAITALYRHYEGTGVGIANKEMLARSSTNLHRGVDATGVFNAVTVTGAALTTSRSQFVTFENLAIFTNGTNAVKQYTIGGSSTDLGGSPPTSEFIEIHFERIFVAGNATNPSRLTFSDVSAPEIFPAASTIEVGENDGDQITGIKRVPGGLLIWKNHSLWILYGNSISSFTLSKLSNNIGCVAPQSIQEVNGRYYFLARDGIYSIVGGGRPEFESFPIQPDIDDILPSGVTDVFGFSHKNRLYGLSYQSFANTDTQNRRLLVMDTWLRALNRPFPTSGGQLTSKSAWTKFTNHTINAVANFNAGDDEGETFWGDSTNGFVNRFQDTNLDITANIGYDVTTKFYGNEIESVYDLMYVDLQASNGILTLESRTSQPSNGGSITYNLTSQATIWGAFIWGQANWAIASETREFKGGFGPNVMGRFIQHRFILTPNNLDNVFRGFNMTFDPQPEFV